MRLFLSPALLFALGSPPSLSLFPLPSAWRSWQAPDALGLLLASNRQVFAAHDMLVADGPFSQHGGGRIKRLFVVFTEGTEHRVQYSTEHPRAKSALTKPHGWPLRFRFGWTRQAERRPSTPGFGAFLAHWDTQQRCIRSTPNDA